jgi:HSP20 family protein
MSWKYTNKRKSDVNGDGEIDSFDPFSFGFGMGFQDIDQLIKGMFRAATSFEGHMENANTVYYGYQVTVGPDGKPHLREFGNVHPTNRGTFEIGSREPFVETFVDNKENILKVVAEMPGVKKEDIGLELTDKALVIKAQNNDRKYDTEVPIRESVDTSSIKASYNNGILEVKLKLKSPPKPKGVTVKVD